jgi:aldose 1-epimerase
MTLEIARVAGGAVEVEVLPGFGARLHRLRIDGHDLIRTPADPAIHVADPYFWGSYPMAPWCNRIAPGRMQVAGHELNLPATFPDGTAIHGQVSQVPWTPSGDGAWQIEAGGDGWPWRYAVGQRIAATDHRLDLDLALTNLSDAPMPAGLGIHPWFRRPVEVAIAAASTHGSNFASSPEPAPVVGELDRRALAPLPDGLDATWTDLASPQVVLRWPDSGIRATIEASSAAGYVVAASPAAIDAVAVEPQTHAPAGIRRLLGGEPGALAMLPAGETLRMAVAITFDRAET